MLLRLLVIIVFSAGYFVSDVVESGFIESGFIESGFIEDTGYHSGGGAVQTDDIAAGDNSSDLDAVLLCAIRTWGFVPFVGVSSGIDPDRPVSIGPSRYAIRAPPYPTSFSSLA